MPGNAFVPFNNRPFATDVKTSSYTIPSGYFARVFLIAEAGATVTIDGDTVLNNSAGVTKYEQFLNAAASDTLTTPAGSFFEGTIYIPSGCTLAVGTTVPFNLPTNTILYDVKFGPGTLVSSSGSGVAVLLGVLRASPTTGTADVWLKTGAVINGTGTWRAFVMEYANIT